MEDNKEKQANGSKEDSIDLLTKKAREERSEFGSAGHDDINKNLGSFGSTVVKQETTDNEVKLDVDAKVVEKASKEKINFERFKKTKRTEKAAKTRFGEKVSIMLRSKKGLRRTWIIEMVAMIVIIAASAVLIGLLTKYKGVSGKEGPIILDSTQKLLKVGLVFAWISLFPCIIPLIYLVTAWFVGINQVASSRIYHMMFWIFGLISLLCFLIGFVLLMFPATAVITYPPMI